MAKTTEQREDVIVEVDKGVPISYVFDETDRPDPNQLPLITDRTKDRVLEKLNLPLSYYQTLVSLGEPVAHPVEQADELLKDYIRSFRKSKKNIDFFSHRDSVLRHFYSGSTYPELAIQTAGIGIAFVFTMFDEHLGGEFSDAVLDTAPEMLKDAMDNSLGGRSVTFRDHMESLSGISLAVEIPLEQASLLSGIGELSRSLKPEIRQCFLNGTVAGYNTLKGVYPDVTRRMGTPLQLSESAA